MIEAGRVNAVELQDAQFADFIFHQIQDTSFCW